MTGRVLRIELRRSAALWTALLVGAAGIAMLYMATRGWGGRWMQLGLWQRQYLFVLFPLGLAAGAWQAGREARSKVGELFGSTARPRWQRVAPTVAAMTLGAAAGYVAMFAGGTALTFPTASYFPPAVLIVVTIGALAMAAAVTLGMAVGAMWPSSMTAPVLAIGGAAALFGILVTARNIAMILLTSLLPTHQEDFATVGARVHVGQALWLVALAATGFLLLAAASSRVRLAAAAPAVVGLALAVAVLPSAEREVMVPDAAATALVCTSDPANVCVTKVHGAALVDVRDPGRKALQILAAKLPDAPTVVRESTTLWTASSEPAPPRTLLVDLFLNERSRPAASQDELLWEMLDGAGTRPCGNIFDPAKKLDVQRHHAARAVAAAWLLDSSPTADQLLEGMRDNPLIPRSLEALRARPAAEQRARVIALRDAAANCDGRDLLDVLVPGGGQK